MSLRSCSIGLRDRMLLGRRPIDTTTGQTVWHTKLPEAGNATPMTYLGSRTAQQYVVIAAGGHLMLGTKAGDSLIAYALPR
jgi:quinoprotein glucose dehydrogenase